MARVQGSDAEAKKEDRAADQTEIDKPTELADRRNLKRGDQADEIDQSLPSKCCLPESIDEFLPP